MKIPEDSFFDKLKSSIDDLIDDEQLSIGRVGHPFTVHEGYFIALRNSIFQRIDSLAQPKGKLITFAPKFKVWYGAAAVLVISLFSAWFFSNPASGPVEELSSEDIIAYFEIEPINYNEISSAVEFTESEVASLNDTYLPLIEEEELLIDSPEMLLEEINQLNEK